MTDPALETVYGQPSWRIASNKVEAWLTKTGGHLGPITFDLGDRKVQPFNIAPWHNEPVDDDLPPILKVLRGDFFCMPFGGNETAYEGERHPPHGETANGRWSVVDGRWSVVDGRWSVVGGRWSNVGGRSSVVGGRSPGDRATTLVAHLEPSVRRGHIEKTILIKDDETVVYQSHRITGMSGQMTFGHHAMLKFPDREGSGIVSTSPFLYAATAPYPVEFPENRGYSVLKADFQFQTLDRVPTVTGDEVDLTRYPARKGFEDLVMLVSARDHDFAWSAVSFPDDGYVWFALKNPESLRNTVLWFSNRGRYYPPWSGRHECVLGVEEVTSYFHYGLDESVASNPVSDLGYPTSSMLEPTEPHDIRYLMGVAAAPAGFGRVESIAPTGEGTVAIRDQAGSIVEVLVDWRFVQR